jgi:hypothetical protein
MVRQLFLIVKELEISKDSLIITSIIIGRPLAEAIFPFRPGIMTSHGIAEHGTNEKSV